SGTAIEGQTLTVPQVIGVLANDTIGADAAGMVVGLSAGDTGMGTIGTMTVTGLYGELTIAADGSYSYVANGSVNAGSQDVFTYTMQDGDGDFSHATLTINFPGDHNVPSAGETIAFVDDEGLSNGIPGGTGDIVVTPDADANEATFSGTLSFNFGGDGPGSVTFEAMNGATGHIGTEDVTYAWDSGSGVLTATVSGGERDGLDLFTVQVTDPLTGQYTVTLLDNVLHEAGGNENNAMADLTYTVTDANNDADTGSLTVNFNDDMPAAYSMSPEVKQGSFSTGNLLSDSSPDGSFGADEGHVTSIAAVGSTKSPNFDNVITEDTPNDFDLFVVGKYGGKLMVDSDTGDYEYKAPLLSNPGAKTETFEFTVIDSDGDTATAQLNMMLDDPNDGTP
ncbi:MAG: VCBS domain-containing protein, partial [Deltaproteobacteria bacterium]|nr:VCBS domain-containing protein [Deltaproteobacteria bacterium]